MKWLLIIFLSVAHFDFSFNYVVFNSVFNCFDWDQNNSSAALQKQKYPNSKMLNNYLKTFMHQIDNKN